MAQEARSRYARAVIGETYYDRCIGAHLLMVGAGGIGCELLKNLVMTGFRRITIIDLDTVDLTNLNRQFLFSTRHLKMPKAVVARETALEFDPSCEIRAIHGNIKDRDYSVDWFMQFDLVLNALDNLEARRHVNAMCCAARRPLVESGTTGFLGQAQPIFKDRTECYDCTVKPVQKSYPVCTIRSTPSAPIHCIVWAKSYLLNQLFGVGEDETLELDKAVESGENGGSKPSGASGSSLEEEISQLKKEANALKDIKNSMGRADYAQKVFDKVFDQDIKRLCSMEDMWKSRRPPEPLSFEHLSRATHSGTNGAHASNGTQPVVKSTQPLTLKDHAKLDRVASFQLFLDALYRLVERAQANLADPISFDKDDEATLDFVVGAANLRADSFGIESKTRFEVKEMAGNIIPAIATTNAIVAGLVVLQALKILKNEWPSCRTVHYSKKMDKVFSLEQLSEPNPACAVCRNAYISLKMAPRLTLSQLLEIAQEKLDLGQDLLVYESERLLYDPDFDDNLSRTLIDLDCGPGKMIKVEDEEGTRYPVIFILGQLNQSDGLYQLGEVPPFLTKPVKIEPKDDMEHPEPLQANGSTVEIDPDLEILVEAPSLASVKRKRPAEQAQESTPSKKSRASGISGDVVEID